MKYIWRKSHARDVAQFPALLCDRFLYDDRRLFALKRLWGQIVTGEGGRSSVVVDPDEPSRILAFGVSIFVDNEFATALDRTGGPFLGREILDRWCADDFTLFDEDAVGERNAGSGLDVLVIHHGYMTTEVERTNVDLRIELGKSFIAEHTGLNMNSFRHEVFSATIVDFASQSGFGVRRRYPEDHPSLVALGPDQRPTIIGLTRSEAEMLPGNFAFSDLFHGATVPRFAFTRVQRQLLIQALNGDTDDVLSRSLGLSLSAIKKRWQSIYDRVQMVSPKALGLHDDFDGHVCPGKRGTEFRRHILAYVQNHREELHPYHAANIERWDTHRSDQQQASKRSAAL